MDKQSEMKCRVFAFVAHSNHPCKVADISKIAEDTENECLVKTVANGLE